MTSLWPCDNLFLSSIVDEGVINQLIPNRQCLHLFLYLSSLPSFLKTRFSSSVQFKIRKKLLSYIQVGVFNIVFRKKKTSTVTYFFISLLVKFSIRFLAIYVNLKTIYRKYKKTKPKTYFSYFTALLSGVFTMCRYISLIIYRCRFVTLSGTPQHTWLNTYLCF